MEEVYVKKESLGRWVAKYFNKDIISINDLISVIEDLDDEVDNWKEKYEDLEQDLHDNYKPISHSEMYGISDSDFI